MITTTLNEPSTPQLKDALFSRPSNMLATSDLHLYW